MGVVLKDIALHLSLKPSTVYRYLARARKILNSHTCIEMLHTINTSHSEMGHCIKLTPRGSEVFALVIQGKDNKTIAAMMGITNSGVRRHKEKMLLCNKCATMLELIAKHHGKGEADGLGVLAPEDAHVCMAKTEAVNT